MAAIGLELPRWDMTPFFPGLSSEEFDQAVGRLRDETDDLRRFFETNRIRGGGVAENGALAPVAEQAVERLNRLLELTRMLSAYVTSFVTTDSRDALAQARNSELVRLASERSKLEKRFVAWLGTIDLQTLIETSPVARDHAFPLRKLADGARRQMSEAEEDLYADLHTTGGSAWTRLYGNVTSRLTVEVDLPVEGSRSLPMSMVRGLASDPDPKVRESAYRAEIAAWERSGVFLAAALNSIKGEQNIANGRRGWSDCLDPALFNNNIDRGALDAMQAAVVESFPDFRRYLKAKAQLLGRQRLAWWDLVAPIGDPASDHRWDWEAATGFIIDQFASYSDRMAALAERAFAERWVDAEPREGKRDGASA